MDSRNSNIYPVNNKDTELFGGYNRSQCAQQTVTTQRQHFLPPYAISVSNNMSAQSIMYNTHQNQSVYNMMYPQSVYRNQNTYTTNYSQPMEWPETCMKNEYKEKYLTEKKKDNCCVDNVTKNLYNYNKNSLLDPNWYYGNCDGQKYSDLPSCSQIPNDTTVNNCCTIKEHDGNVKSVKYCSIQKLPENDPKLFGYTKQYDNNLYLNQYNKLSKEYPSCSQLTQTCNLYSGSTCLEIDKKILMDQCDIQSTCDVLSNQYYQQADSTLQSYIDVPKMVDKVDESNCNGGESDIVVEDSDEESDDSEEMEKEEIPPCIICRSSVMNDFYDITSDVTLTSYSQTKVSEKLFQILGWISHASKNLCGECMKLLNSYDQLEIQLDAVRKKILDKYKIATKLQVDSKENEVVSEVEIKKLNRPQKRVKFKSLNFQCRICRKVFSLRSFYKYHISKHKSKRLFLCEQCGCKFPNRSKLKIHHKNHIKKCYKTILKTTRSCTDEKVFICHLCGKLFKTRTNLREHENICSGNLPFRCPICSKQFPSTTKLNNHTKLLHEQKYCNSCQKCGKGFVKQSDYKTHLLSHSNEKKFKCTECNKIYKSLSNLNQHKKMHNEKLPFNCTVCCKGFLRKENLESHLNNHNGIKPFNCTLCDKKFVSQKNLDAHLKVHNGSLKRKTCSVCGKQVIHGLVEHMRTHSNFKAFSCTECTMKFLTKGALAKHTKRKHENKELDVLKI